MSAEKNRVTKFWSELDMKAANAAESQALLQLKKHFCDRKQCLRCAVGNHVLKKNYEV